MKTLLLCFLFVFASPTPATACLDISGDNKTPTEKERFDNSTVIFIGVLQNVRHTGNLGLPLAEITFKVTHLYKGQDNPKEKPVKILTGYGVGDCGVDGLAQAQIGSIWLVYARKVVLSRTEFLARGRDDLTSPLKDATEKTLQFLNSVIFKEKL